ncbi:hypothetical protein F5877DRAFT_72851 [Lentinula edodes]|nr:hypothetical protein F5877DRAFT_72851 [Lentinula edodes]
MATRFLKFHQFDLQLALQLDNDGRMEVESSFCNYPSWIHINDKKIRSRIWRSASITDQGWGDETVYQIGTAPIGALQTIPLIPEANRNTYGEEDRVAFYPVPDTARPISWLQGITTGMSSAKIRSSSLKEFGAILDDSNSMLGIAPLQHQSQQPVVHFHSVILEAYVPAKYVYVAIPSLLPLILSPTIKILTTVHISRYHEPGFRWVVIVPLHVAGVKGVQNESYQDDAYNGGSEDDQDDDSVYDGGAYDGSDGAYGGSRRAYDGNNSAYDDSNGANDQTVQNPFRDSIINPYLPGYIPPNPVTQLAIKSYAEGTRESKLEKMLSLCHLFFKLYLMEAAAKVPSTFGFSKMLKKYSGLNYKGGFRRSDTYAKYGGAGTNIICFLLRYFEMKRKKKLPALLRISLGMELLEAVKRLYLESQKDSEPSVSELAPLLHAILVCFVRTHDPLDSDKLTLLEYILLCLTIREDTKAGEDGQCIYEAVVFTRKLSHYARLISATVLQAMVAGGWEEQYHLPSPEDAAISDAELDHIDDSDSDSSSTDSDSLDLENDFDLEDLVEITKFTPEQVTLGERLDKALREYVSKDSTKKNTFRVLISLWARADGYSRSAKGKKSFRPDASNLGFTFIPTPTSEIHCDLAIFPQNHELQLKGLRTSFARLIPASLASYFQENFRTTDLVDDPASPVSIFDQPRNAPYFDGLIATLTNALEQSKGPDRTLARRGQLSSDRVWSWIEDLAEFQKYLAGGIIPTMGVCPRAEQIAALTYATVGTTLRSLKIYQPHVLICNPIAKQDSAKQYECFFALPPDMAWYLILYLGVLRKVVIHLLESPVIRHAGPVEDFKHYIFVILTKGRLNAIPNTYQWTATDVNICLKGTLLRLDANSLRHVTTGVIRHWYPELGEARERLNDSTLMSPVDRQGQHSGRVSRNFYARTIYMTGTGFNTSEFFSQIRVSMALQRLDQIIRNGGRNVVPTAIDISDAWTRNGEHAMNTAREFVMSPAGYNIVSGNTDAIESSFKKLNRLRPFLWGPDVRPLEVEVDPKFVAHGVYLVNCAVDEWRKGSFQACGWNIDPNREVRVSEIENAIIHFRRDQPEEWITFRGKVGHSILSSIGRPPPQFSKMPFFAPGVFSAPAPPSDIQGEDIPLQDVPLDTIVTSEKGKGREIEDDVQSPYTDVETEIEDGVQSPLFTDIETAIEDGGAGTQSKKTKEVEKQNRREEKKRSKQGADHLLVPGGSKGVWGQKRKRQSKDDNSLKKSRDSTSSD